MMRMNLAWPDGPLLSLKQTLFLSIITITSTSTSAITIMLFVRPSGRLSLPPEQQIKHLQ